LSASLVFYYRNGCHLCEEMAAFIHRGWPDAAETMEWRDVDEQADWKSRYGLRVPVLLAGNEVVCELQPDRLRLEQYFGTSRNPL
jgi:hypothetical protein